MNDEEKKAIEQLNLKAITSSIEAPDYPNAIVRKKDLITILNLIEKQDKEINKLKAKNNELLRKLKNRVKDVKKLQKYSLYKKEFSTLSKRIEKQSKIIQAMAEEIVQFRNECDLENDTKETVIEEYEEQYIIWKKI